MASIREQIIQAVIAQLKSGAPPASVYRSRTDALSASGGQLPAFVVYPLHQETDNGAKTLALQKLTLRIECLVSAVAATDGSTSAVESALDPLLIFAVQKLLADFTLGGLALDVDESATQWATDTADLEIEGAAIDFEILYEHQRSDPTAQ